jgi:hypothetical protein
VLFSDAQVAEFIDAKFEPTWKSLRPVPKVSVDFGNGKVIERTLNGNIATFVCTADGTIIDVIAGIYDKREYLSALKHSLNAAASLPQDGPERLQALRAYHVAESAARMYRPPSFTIDEFLGSDAELNQTERKRIIHSKLAMEPADKPDDLTHWLYREVLHADLDDPYLGLAPVLFASYPFKDGSKN